MITLRVSPVYAQINQPGLQDAFAIIDTTGIVLTNTTPDVGEETTDTTMILIGTVASAIVGGVVGSFFTYFFGNRIEQRKERALRIQEESYSIKIRNLVKHDLDNIFDFLVTLTNKCDASTGNYLSRTEEYNATKYNLEYPLHFRSMPFDTKARIFEPHALEILENVYSRVEAFRLSTIQTYANTEKELLDYGARVFLQKRRA